MTGLCMQMAGSKPTPEGFRYARIGGRWYVQSPRLNRLYSIPGWIDLADIVDRQLKELRCA